MLLPGLLADFGALETILRLPSLLASFALETNQTLSVRVDLSLALESQDELHKQIAQSLLHSFYLRFRSAYPSLL